MNSLIFLRKAFLAALLLCSPSLTQAADESLQWSVELWWRHCQADGVCGAPQSLAAAVVAEKSSGLQGQWAPREAAGPGEAERNRLELSWSFNENEAGISELKAELNLWSMWPKAESGLPRYEQIEFRVLSPIRMRCAQDVRRRWPRELPPMSCSAPINGARAHEYIEIGVNVRLVPVID